MADKYTNTYPKVGNAAYGSGKPRSGDMRKGMVVPKKNGRGGSPDVGTATHRQGVPQATLGAQYRITATRTPYNATDEMAPTQANGRIMPSAVGSRNNFRSGGLTYGPM